MLPLLRKRRNAEAQKKKLVLRGLKYIMYRCVCVCVNWLLCLDSCRLRHYDGMQFSTIVVLQSCKFSSTKECLCVYTGLIIYGNDERGLEWMRLCVDCLVGVAHVFVPIDGTTLGTYWKAQYFVYSWKNS